jgi:uncharacterized protein with PQ loop repeat
MDLFIIFLGEPIVLTFGAPRVFTSGANPQRISFIYIASSKSLYLLFFPICATACGCFVLNFIFLAQNKYYWQNLFLP